jgi:hypothetical protein
VLLLATAQRQVLRAGERLRACGSARWHAWEGGWVGGVGGFFEGLVAAWAVYQVH